MKKGASSLVIVFIILVVSLIAVSWLRANTTSGTGLQSQIIQESGIDTLNHRFENTKLYLENSLFYAGQKGSDLAGNYSGRKWKNPEARYWYCKGSPQAASVTAARNATSNFTLKAFNDRIDEVHGIRERHVYSVGEVACLETGYNTPRDSVDNNRFKQGMKIESINVSRENGNLKSSKKNFTFSKEVIYNRYWFMYSNLKEWVRNTDVENEVTSALHQVEDHDSRTTNQCLTDGSKCTYPDTYMCQTNHGEWLESAISDGINEEINQLENNEQFFNGSNVNCNGPNYNENRNTGTPYPGIQVTINEGTGYRNISGDTPCGWTGEEGESTPKWDYACTKSWDLDFQAYADFTVTCVDETYKMIPNKTRKPLTWKIDLSFTATETQEDSEYSESMCDTTVEPGVSYLPNQLNTCSFSRSATTCQTPVDTTQ